MDTKGNSMPGKSIEPNTLQGEQRQKILVLVIWGICLFFSKKQLKIENDNQQKIRIVYIASLLSYNTQHERKKLIVTYWNGEATAFIT